MIRWTRATHGETCMDCLAEAEDIPASYILSNGDAVCDSHLDIRTTDGLVDFIERVPLSRNSVCAFRLQRRHAEALAAALIVHLVNNTVEN